jgi:hypothetical protein
MNLKAFIKHICENLKSRSWINIFFKKKKIVIGLLLLLLFFNMFVQEGRKRIQTSDFFSLLEA